MASLPVVRRTRTHFRFAELGFFGFLITVFITTPLKEIVSSFSGKKKLAKMTVRQNYQERAMPLWI